MSFYTKKQIIDGHILDRENFTANDVLFAAGFNDTRPAAHWLGLSRRTLQRYIERNRLPGPVLWALRYRAGDLSGIGAGLFDGWHLVGDTLISTHGHQVTRADLVKHSQMLYRLYCAEQENAALKAKLAPPVPPGEAATADPSKVVPLFPLK